MTRTPWWFRWRSPLFGAIFAFGFAASAFATTASGGPYVPAFVAVGSHWGRAGVPALFWIGIALVAACWALRVWGSSYLSASVVWDARVRIDSLIVAGPFRFTRNPLYLGNVLLAIGVGLLAPWPGWIFLIVANVAYVYVLIACEERDLLATYGDAFRRYCKTVPRLFPRLTPVPAQGAMRPSLVQGLLTEVFTGAILAGAIGYGLFGAYGWIVFFVCYAVGIAAQVAIVKSQSKEEHP